MQVPAEELLPGSAFAVSAAAGSDGPINRCFSCPIDHYDDREADGQDVILDAFTLLISVPVHEEAVGRVDREDCDHHVGKDPECGDPAQATEDQSQRAGKFSSNCQKCQRGWDVHHPSEEPHGPSKAVATEPTEDLLGTMREHDNAKRESSQCGGETIAGVEEQFECFHRIK